MEWLNEMPAAACPEGCVVRRGETLGVVTKNRGGYWVVAYIGRDPRFSAMGEEGEPRGGPPESDGWRHALDHRNGFAYVLDEVARFASEWIESGRNMHNAGLLLVALDGAKRRHIRGKTTDDDRAMMAKNFTVARTLAKAVS